MSNLPPGCADADVDRAGGNDPDELDARRAEDELDAEIDDTVRLNWYLAHISTDGSRLHCEIGASGAAIGDGLWFWENDTTNSYFRSAREALDAEIMEARNARA